MKRPASTWFFLIGLCAGLAPTGRAQGQGAEEYVLILLDRSASMGDAAVTGASGPAFWDNALAAAQNWVQHDKETLRGDARPSRAYAVWTFLDDTCGNCRGSACSCPNTQKNVKQVWPPLGDNGGTLPSTECTRENGGTFEGLTGMCVFAPGGPGDKMYDLLKNKVLPALAKQRPGSHGNTPLGESLCLAVEKLQASAHD